MCGMKLRLHTQSLAVQLFKFGNREVTSSHTVLGM